MKNRFPAAVLRFVIPGLLATAALAPVACKKDTTADNPYDYAMEDDATIQKYLTDNHITNAQKQASGLYYIPVITNPNGLRATAGRTVSVNYTGTLLNGTVFDATSQHFPVAPFSFALGAGYVIKGWDEGIALMKLDEKSILLIPSRYGYGSQSKASIPANSILRFEVELTKIQ